MNALEDLICLKTEYVITTGVYKVASAPKSAFLMDTLWRSTLQGPVSLVRHCTSTLPKEFDAMIGAALRISVKLGHTCSGDTNTKNTCPN